MIVHNFPDSYRSENRNGRPKYVSSVPDSIDPVAAKCCDKTVALPYSEPVGFDQNASETLSGNPFEIRHSRQFS